MTALMDFIRLNGYGVYVWPAFGFAAIVLGGLGLWARARLRAAEAALAMIEAARNTDARR